ncbi:MAG: hypothetical protein HQL13_06595 [Candidatus Omnitrophica bacterium]|nr:hypothetical protein [Candidatus Omnitrophota bacterium]
MRKLFDLYSLVKRDGREVSFKQEKIAQAIDKAFIAHNNGVNNDSLVDLSHCLASKVVDEICKKWPEGRAVHIEEVQDIVEKVLMVSGFYEVSKRYIVYREERAKARGESSLIQAHS